MMKSPHKILLLSAMSIGILLSFNVSAQSSAGSMPCSPQALQAIKDESEAQMKQAHELLDNLNKGLANPPTDANGASAMSLMQQCVGSYWPGGGFRMPTLQDLINAAKAYVAQQCGNLRSKITESLPSMQDASFSTGIPGLPNIGYSGGVNQGGSAPVWTVNGQNPSTGLGGMTQSNTPLTTGGLTQGISNSLPYQPSPQPAPQPTNTNPPKDTGSPIDKLKCVFGGC